MEKESPCDCVMKAMAMIPMPVSGMAEALARRLCAWEVPPYIVAITIIEMLLGTDRHEHVNQRVKNAREDLVNAFTSGFRGVDDLKAAAEILNEDYTLDVWSEICDHLEARGVHPNQLEARLLFQHFRSGKISDAASAERFILEQRKPQAPTASTERKPGITTPRR